MPKKQKPSNDNIMEARTKAIAVHAAFEASFKTLQKMWTDNEMEEAMKKANVWASYKRLGTFIDDDGPWRKVLDAIRQKGQL